MPCNDVVFCYLWRLLNIYPMSKREAILRYNLIIGRLRKSPASFNDIDQYLEREGQLQEYNLRVSKRTFQRDLDDIRLIYSIDIQFDFSSQQYLIEYADDPNGNIQLLEAFDTLNAFKLTANLSSKVYFEKRQPQGTENLYGLIHAIQNQFVISFKYKKFYTENITDRKVYPLALKEHKNRWYLIAEDKKDDKIKSFGLDRLSSMEITQETFKKEITFDVNKYYKNSFGIISSESEQPEEILLSFNSFQGKYIKSMPLHETQQIIEDNNDRLVVKMKLYITYDFIMEILSMGPNVKVLQPQKLRNNIMQAHIDSFKSYEKEHHTEFKLYTD